MPTIPAIKPTDSADEARVKNNSAIARVNALDDTAENIAAFAASANAAAREAAGYRDGALEVLGDAEQVAAGAVEARDAAVQARVGAEQARGVATAARDTAVEAKDDAEAARGGAEAAQEAAETAQGAAEAAAGRAEAAEGLAIDHRDRAETAADRAEAAENSLLEWKGAWATARAYAPSDIVRAEGSAYVCLAAHTSGTFSTDRGAGKWEVFAQQGAPGPGSGDMLASVYDTEGREVDVYERGNHTGAQAISTVTGLQAALDGKAAATHGHDIDEIDGLDDALTAALNADNHVDGETWGRITKDARDWAENIWPKISHGGDGALLMQTLDGRYGILLGPTGGLTIRDLSVSPSAIVPIPIGAGGTGGATALAAANNMKLASGAGVQSLTDAETRNIRNNSASSAACKGTPAAVTIAKNTTYTNTSGATEILYITCAVSGANGQTISLVVNGEPVYSGGIYSHSVPASLTLEPGDTFAWGGGSVGLTIKRRGLA